MTTKLQFSQIFPVKISSQRIENIKNLKLRELTFTDQSEILRARNTITSMGIFDSIVDTAFRGGAKREALETLATVILARQAADCGLAYCTPGYSNFELREAQCKLVSLFSEEGKRMMAGHIKRDSYGVEFSPKSTNKDFDSLLRLRFPLPPRWLGTNDELLPETEYLTELLENAARNDKLFMSTEISDDSQLKTKVVDSAEISALSEIESAIFFGLSNATITNSIVRKMLKCISEVSLSRVLNIKTDTGRTGLMLAMENGRADVIHAIAPRLAHMDGDQLFSLLMEKSDDGSTGLALAMKNGHANVIASMKQVLDKLRPDQLAALLQAKDNDSFTGLMLAMRNCHDNVIEALSPHLKRMTYAQATQVS